MEDVFVYPLKNSNEYNEIINTICNKEGSLQLNGLLDMQKPHITYSIFKELADRLCLLQIVIWRQRRSTMNFVFILRIRWSI